MKIVFMGTPDFAVTCLEALITAGHEVSCVFTQPDRPKGRGNKFTPPPVKVRAEELGLPVFQPLTVKDEGFLALLKEYDPQIIVVVAYGRILPESVLKLPPYGCLNVHGSLLPKYRGAAPIQWAVLNGESQTGVTIMQMDVGMDTGDMLLQGSIPIEETDTTGTMFEKLAYLGGELLLSTLAALEAGTVVPMAQQEAEATHAPMLTKEHELIDWSQSAHTLHHQVKGLSPAPGAYTGWQGERLKIWKTQVEENDRGTQPGEVVEIAEDSFVVQAGKGSLRIFELQPAGKKAMPAKAFLNGAGLKQGDILGFKS